jgi:hypothetical protein
VPIEFTFTLLNTPGVLAEVGTALGQKGINIEALAAMSTGDKAVLHLVVNDTEAAAREIEDYGVPFRCREVLEVQVRDAPGTLGKLADAIAESGGNIDAAYLTTHGTVILSVSDLAEATAIARRLGNSV